MDNNTPIQMFDVLWSAGKHSLCAQVNGDRFRSIGQFEDPLELLAAAERLPRDANVWWGVHGMEPPERGRGGVEHVVEVTTLCADFDWADPLAHKDALLPTEGEVRAVVATMQPKPTVVVSSGHGLQAYWGLVEGLDRDCGEQLSEGFFRWVEAEYGLHNDRVDLASVLRLPGTFNNKAEPVEVTIEYIDAECGYFAAWLFDNCWAPAPQVRSLASVPVASPHSPTAVQVSAPTPAADGESPLEWLNRTFDSTACLLRLGWTEGHQKYPERQFTRPGKDPRQGTSATLHLDTGAVNIFSTTLDPIYTMVGLAGKGCVTLKPADLWMVENGISSPSEASRLVRAQMSPREAGVAVTSPASTGQDNASRTNAVSGLNLPDEFWQARGYLTHIRDAAWSTSCSPDAVLAAVMARYSANLHPSIMLPQWGTLDLFVVIAGHSGAYKSKAGKTARQLWAGSGDSAVLMDRNVGSGEGLAEAFFEWRDEDGNPCGSGKKGAVKVRTRWGLHFSTDESTALAASAARAGAIVIQTLCQAWMGEAIGQLLADPTKSRMIEPNQVRVSAELKIQTVHGHKLFAEEYASTGLAQRMVCFTSLDPSIHERFEAGVALPSWPGALVLPRPFLLTGGQPRILELSPAIARHLAAADAAGHSPTWAGDPLDTHANLSRLKVAAILTLMDDRFSISDSDWELAGIVLDSHRAVRSMLQATKKTLDAEAKVTIVTSQIEREVGVDEGKHKALLRRAVAALQARIQAGKPLGKKYLSGPQRDVYEESMGLLEAQGLVRELPEGGWVAV